MRNSLLFLLLASSAIPAIPADESDDRSARREAARAERAEARAAVRAERESARSQPTIRMERSIVRPSIERDSEDRSGVTEAIRERLLERRPSRIADTELQRRTHEQRREAIEPRLVDRRPPRVVEVEPAHPRLDERREAIQQRVRESRGPRIVEVDSDVPALDSPKAVDSVREWRRSERAATGRPALVEQRTDTGWEPLRKRTEQSDKGFAALRAPIISRIPREGTQPPAPAVARPARLTTHHWRGDWRSDHRYDWRKHRRRHRSLFHFGFYYDPFGWAYRPYSIGWRLWPSYYRSNYWLHDAWTYRLPYAPPGYRWIRYYDDVLLVDTWDGRVVDVIRNFFW